MKYVFYTILLIMMIPLHLWAQDSLELLAVIPSPFEHGFANRIIADGDLNGDGYDDIIYANKGPFNSSGDYWGELHIIFGGPDINTSPDIVLTGEHNYDRFGSVASIAGDLNGDGYDDLVISAPYFDMFPQSDIAYGRAYVYLGGDPFDADPDLILDGYLYTDDAWNLQFGSQIDTSGDLNNDGYNDIVIGSPGPSFFFNGQIDVFLGGETMDSEVDWHYKGENLEGFGTRISIGDLNGDSYDDLITSSGEWEPDNVMIKIYLGNESVLSEPVWQTNLGYQFALEADGDFNGDGFSDLFFDDNDTDDNQVSFNVVWGTDQQNLLELLDVPLISEAQFMNLFFAELNNDNYDDLVLIQEYDEFQQYEGRVEIHYGASEYNPEPDIVMTGNLHHQYFGGISYHLGDVNYDGYNDILLGTSKTPSCPATHDTLFIYTKAPVSIEEGPSLVTASNHLVNYPNPFVSQTTIEFYLPQPGRANVSIYNIAGQKIQTLINSNMIGGLHKITWNGTQSNHETIPAGVYLLKLQNPITTQTHKMIKLSQHH